MKKLSPFHITVFAITLLLVAIAFLGETEKPEINEPLKSYDVSLFRGIVLSKVYGNGGKTDAAAAYGFLELYNTTEQAISVEGLAAYYSAKGDTAYASFAFPSATIAPHGYYLVRCGSCPEDYDQSKEIFSVDSFDASWDQGLDNHEFRLLLAPVRMNYSVDTNVRELPSLLSYFVAAAEENSTNGYVSDLSKNKMAVRTALTEYSGFYVLNLTKSLSSKLSQVAPSSSAAKNTVVRSAVREVFFSAPAGCYKEDFRLSLSAEDDYKIYYTLDGSDPRTSLSRVLYSAPIAEKPAPATNESVPTAIVVKAYATNGTDATEVFTNTYFVSSLFKDFSVPVASLSLDGEDFCGPNGFYNNYSPLDEVPNVRSLAMMEVFDPNGERVGYSNVELAVSGHASASKDMKSLRIYYKGVNNHVYRAQTAAADGHTKDEYKIQTEAGLEDELHYDLFEGRAVDSDRQAITDFSRLLFRNSGNDCGYSYMRDAYMQQACQPLHIDTMASAPILVFINGEFWGVYNARERYSGEYVESHYGEDKDDITFLESDYAAVAANRESGFVVSSGEDGAEADFSALMDYVKTHDLADPACFAYLSSRIDMDSFMDLWVARLYFNATDFPRNNVKIWRSDSPDSPNNIWHFTLQDMDFGMSVLLADGTDTCEDKSVFHLCDNITDCATGLMMHKLLANVSFKTQFIARFRECVETVFQKEKLAALLDQFVESRKSLMELQFARWASDGANPDTYQAEIEKMYQFVENRADYALQYLEEYFDILP